MPDGRHEPSSIERAVAAHERALLRYVAHLLHGHAEPARDVVQEAFARLCQQTRDVALPEWLFAVCRNLAIDRLRRDRRTRERTMSLTEIELPSRVSPADPVERGEDERRAIDLLTTLPPRQQEAIRLKFQGGLTYPQVAVAMHTNENNVAVLIHLGLRRLREQMA